MSIVVSEKVAYHLFSLRLKTRDLIRWNIPYTVTSQGESQSYREHSLLPPPSLPFLLLLPLLCLFPKGLTLWVTIPG